MATLLLTLLLVCTAIAILLWVKTPYYRVERCNVEALLELVVAGRASENDWAVFTGVEIRQSEFLESVRLRCIDIEEREYTGAAQPPFLFSKAGITELQQLLDDVRQFREK